MIIGCDFRFRFLQVPEDLIDDTFWGMMYIILLSK